MFVGVIIGAVLILMEWSRTPWQWIGIAAVVAAVITTAALSLWYRQYVLPLPTLLFASLTATAVFHVQRLSTVRSLLRTEVGHLERHLPGGTSEEHLRMIANRALDMLMRQTQWKWIDLKFLSGEKELIHLKCRRLCRQPERGRLGASRVYRW